MLSARILTGDTIALREALEAASLPADDLTEAGRTFVAFEDDGQEVGFGGFELYGSNALLRSVVITPELRGQGYGRLVCESILKQAFDLGAREAYLLTTTAAPFFETLGFARIERELAPPAILNTKQAATLCPSTASMLTRALNG